jgi:hypothetical protein
MPKQTLLPGEFALTFHQAASPVKTTITGLTFGPPATNGQITMTLTCTFMADEWVVVNGTETGIKAAECGVFDTQRQPPNQAGGGAFSFTLSYDKTKNQVKIKPQANDIISLGTKGERGISLQNTAEEHGKKN